MASSSMLWAALVEGTALDDRWDLECRKRESLETQSVPN